MKSKSLKATKKSRSLRNKTVVISIAMICRPKASNLCERRNKRISRSLRKNNNLSSCSKKVLIKLAMSTCIPSMLRKPQRTNSKPVWWFLLRSRSSIQIFSRTSNRSPNKAPRKNNLKPKSGNAWKIKDSQPRRKKILSP